MRLLSEIVIAAVIYLATLSSLRPGDIACAVIVGAAVTWIAGWHRDTKSGDPGSLALLRAFGVGLRRLLPGLWVVVRVALDRKGEKLSEVRLTSPSGAERDALALRESIAPDMVLIRRDGETGLLFHVMSRDQTREEGGAR